MNKNIPELQVVEVEADDAENHKKLMETYHRLNLKLDEILLKIKNRKEKKNEK